MAAISLNFKALILVIFLANSFLNAQGEFKSADGYSPHIGSMVFMLDDIKDRITEHVKDLNQSEVDFQYDAQANSIGALIMHLVSTESYY